ncbi:hypothetical protein PMAYCL1PPCAC_32092, partial [Pristionchus mayeri]
MHIALTVISAVFLLIAQGSLAQDINIKAIKEQCDKDMAVARNSETDNDLKAKMNKLDEMFKSSIALVKGLSDAQKARLLSSYFVGACAPMK